jgi:cysteine-rich repeat protein
MHLPFEGMLRFLDGTGATSTYLGPIGRPVQSQFGNSVDSPMTVIDAVLRSTTPITGLVVTPPRFCVTALTAAGHDSPLDACDQDSDGDGIEGLRDNCPDDLNADQADIDGDGDGDVCDPPLCGNAVIEAGEACDDGNLLDGDGCESTCTVTALCEQLVSLTKGKIVVKKLGAPVGDELLEFSGTLAIPLGEALDPVLTGLQLLVDDPTGAAPVLDLTERTNPVPPGAMAPSTCDPNPVVGKKKKDGWMLNKSGTTFTYHNRTGALPAAGCAAGSARGLRKIIVKDLRAGKGVVTFKVVAGPAVFGPPNGPLAGSILFGAGSSTGPCGQVDFVAEACASNNNGTMLTCR